MLVVGQSHLAQRLGEWVDRLGVEAALAPLGPARPGLEAAWKGRPQVAGLAEDPHLVEGWPLDDCEAVLLCAAEDDLNLDLALRVRDRKPDLRLVIALRNPGLGRIIERELGHCAVLSAPDAAASALALAALHPGAPPSFRHGDRYYCLREAEGALRMEPAEVLLGRTEPEPPSHGGAQALRKVGLRDRYLARTMALVALLLTLATTYFHFSQGLPWMSAFYFVVTTFCTVGYGDYSLKDASDFAKAVGIVLMLGSVTLTAALFALLTNALMQRREDAREGRRRYRLKGHVVVCGLGVAGLRVAECLLRLGQKVLVVERDRRNPLLAECTAAGIPYMVADATVAATLQDANLPEARALVSVLNDDLANLEIGLAGREQRPDLRVVLRVFDSRFAARVERHFHIPAVLSTSALAAPAFLARALVPEGLTLVEQGGRWWVARPAASSEGEPDLVLEPWSA